MKLLPVLVNMFVKPAVQNHIAGKLDGAELQLFESNGMNAEGTGKDWTIANPENYTEWCSYYCMVGVSPAVWVFAPSMVGRKFRVNGSWWTVEKVEKDGYASYPLVRLNNGDEAEDVAERLGYAF